MGCSRKSKREQIKLSWSCSHFLKHNWRFYQEICELRLQIFTLIEQIIEAIQIGWKYYSSSIDNSCFNLSWVRMQNKWDLKIIKVWLLLHLNCVWSLVTEKHGTLGTLWHQMWHLMATYHLITQSTTIIWQVVLSNCHMIAVTLYMLHNNQTCLKPRISILIINTINMGI